MNTTVWAESIPASEAAPRLLAFVQEIRDLDAKVEEVNTRKAHLYREAGQAGFNSRAMMPVPLPTTSEYYGNI